MIQSSLRNPGNGGTPTDDDGESLSREEIADFLEDHPRLTFIRPFLALADRINWFSAVGDPIDREVMDFARTYLDSLGFPDAQVALVGGWDEAASAAQSLDWDTAAWEAEEQLRASLTQIVLDEMGEETLEIAVAHAAASVAPAIRSAAEEAAAIWDLADEALVTAAAGAAVQSLHLAILSLLAADPGEVHPFAAKFRLFEAGRWPVGIAGSSFNLF